MTRAEPKNSRRTLGVSSTAWPVGASEATSASVRFLGARKGPLGGISSGAEERRGVVLVFFAVFFLALFGLMSVVVDFGIVRLTQLQMQNSADVAALEGLSGRDVDLANPAAADLARRELASGFAAAVFDEDLNRDTAPAEFLLGAGPIVSRDLRGLADPAGGLLVDAEGRISEDGDSLLLDGNAQPFVPDLQTNVAENLASGDLVAGSYTELDVLDPGRNDWHDEANDYQRLDFAPQQGGTAFLARLRRTRENQPLDRVAGVSSAGPTLPFLFGLGSASLGTPDPAVYDPRRDGVTVRAAAIADARRVTAAGFARVGMPGLAPLALDVATSEVRWLSIDEVSWISLPVGTGVALEVDPSGAVTGALEGAAVLGSPRLGAPLLEGPVALPGAPPAELEGLVYATLHRRDAVSGALRIVEFVALELTAVVMTADGALRLEGIKLGTTIAPRNASAQPALAFDAGFATPSPVGADGLRAAVLAR